MDRSFVRLERFRCAPFGRLILASLLSATLLVPAGCSRPKEAARLNKQPEAPRDLCALVTNGEVERIMGASPQRSHSSEIPGEAFAISQCQYEMSASANSVTVSVMRRAPGPKGRDPKNFLEERIADYEKREGEREKGEENRGLDFVPGLGDKALWMGTMVGGNLYVLKDHLLIRIAVGSTKDPSKRKAKTVELARLLVSRL
jgi:hypothetical protein